MTELIDAILRGDGAAAVAAVATGDARAVGADGTPALLLAHYRGMRDVVEGIRRQRGDDLTLAEAAALGDVAAVARRLGEGVSVEERSPDGFTPLQLAAHFDHAAVAAVLVRAGADLAARAQGVLTVQALHAAAASPTGQCVPLLVAAGAPLDDPQDRGFRPLHELALRGLDDLVELLLAAGADPAVTDDEGRDGAAHAEAGGYGALAARLRVATGA